MQEMPYPQVKVVILTSYNEFTTINRALDTGADGYILKNSEPEELLEGIHTVASGERFLCEEVDSALQKTTIIRLNSLAAKWNSCN